MTWLLLLPLSWLATLLACLGAPVIVLFARADGALPGWLAWSATLDNTLDGDNGWKTEHLVGWPRYLKRIAWIWRNPAYTFEERFLGATISAGMPISVDGDPNIKNREHAVSGRLFVAVGPYWCWKAIQSLFGDHCLMLEFGWKLQPYAQLGNLWTESDSRAQFVCSIRITAFYGDQ